MENNGVHENGNGSAFDSLIEDSSRSKSKDHGWQTVVYPKRKKQPAKEANSVKTNGDVVFNGDAAKSSVYQSLEQHADERRKRAEAQRAAIAEKYGGLGNEINEKVAGSDDDSDEGAKAANGAPDGEEKKPKQKKPKKPKVTMAEAAAKIDAANLSDFLAEITASYEKAPDVQLMRFADYFARVFSSLSASQFSLNKILKESSVAKLAEVPLCYIPEAVQKTSGDWINQQPSEALNNFTLWALSSVIEDMGAHQAGHKGSKQTQPVAAKGKAAVFVALALVLRRRPDLLLQLSPTIKTGAQFQGQDKLYAIVWAIAQACRGDLVVGMSLWVQNLLPLTLGKKSTLPRDLTLQLIESCILDNMKKARPILLNSAVRKGERLVPPPALTILMQLAFPLDSARTKATEKFVAIYPFIKELALVGANRSKSTRPVAQQLMPLSLAAISEENPALTDEAASIFIWCLSQNSDCYKQWEKLHLEHTKASTVILEKLIADWKKSVSMLSPMEDLKQTLKSLRLKHEEVFEAHGGDPGIQATVKVADKHCKAMLRKLSRVAGCVKFTTVTALFAVLIAVCIILAMPHLEKFPEWKRLALMFGESFSF
uniref:Uncharacterized protein n=1 Tax=Araucaria cunninghamii TaxID=56994 RepID=A0A0D6R0Y1_ARACU